MEYRSLGRSVIEVCRISLGCGNLVVRLSPPDHEARGRLFA